MGSADKASNYILASVNKALEVLDLLSNNYELSATEVSRMLNIGKSTAFRLLATLESKNYVQKDSHNKYRLSLKLAYMGSLVLNRMEIIRFCRPYLQQLSRMTNETVNLVILEEDNEVRFIDKISSPSIFRIEAFVGGKKPAYCTATGKVLLACKDQKAINDYLENVHFIKFTDNTVQNAEDFYRMLMQTRQLGYGTNRGESEVGLTSFAVPIFNPSAEAIAAISISGPNERMVAREAELIEALKSIAGKISDNM